MVDCRLKQGNGITLVALSGDVDLESSPKVRSTLLECVEKGGAVVVDMFGVTYIDSSGVASLVEAYQAARKAGASFELARVSPSAMRVLELARLDKVFTIRTTLPDVSTDAG